MGGVSIAAINHIGNTAIKTIWAKPIVDILVEIENSNDMQTVKKRLLEGGYLCMSESDTRMSFNKGYTKNGFADRVFHIHIRISGDNDELFFCDYLNENMVTAKEYEKLKFSLWKKYENIINGGFVP